MTISLGLNRYISDKTRAAKAERTRIGLAIDRHIVRLAMSKFEVLQNN